MIGSRSGRRRCCWIWALLCALGCAFGLHVWGVEPIEASHAVTADPQYDVVFPSDRVLDIQLLLRADAWTLENEMEWTAHGTLVYEDLSWDGVEVRVSSEHLSAWRDGLHAPDLVVRFELPHAPQRFFGFAELELRSTPEDPARLRLRTGLDLVRAAGVPAPRATSCLLTVVMEGENTHLVALYTLLEVPGFPMLDTQFDDNDGSLYIVEGEAARLAEFDPHGFIPIQLADPELEAPSPDHLVQAIQDALYRRPMWRVNLESIFDMYEAIRGMAVRAALGSPSGYGLSLEPMSLYWDPGDARYHLIFNREIDLAPQQDHLLSTSLDTLGEHWPLLQLIADDPAYFATYLGYLDEALKGVFQVRRVQEQLRAAQASIVPLLEKDEPSSFLPSRDTFNAAVDELLLAVEDRYALVEDMLLTYGFRESPIVISEIHYNPSLEQGIDNNFEFVELFNRGNRTVDLSGYMFVAGLEFALPPQTVLSPGQCLLLSKRAETYRNAPCEVQQWARGSLSNGGEVLRLVDRDGVEVDSVKFDDDAPWPRAADSGGASLEIIDPKLPNYTHVNWRASDSLGGSPGWIEP